MIIFDRGHISIWLYGQNLPINSAFQDPCFLLTSHNFRLPLWLMFCHRCCPHSAIIIAWLSKTENVNISNVIFTSLKGSQGRFDFITAS